VNGEKFVRLDGTLFIHGLAGHVEHAAHDGLADGHRNGRACVGDFHAALESLSAAHGHGAHPVVAEMLLHLEGQLGFGWRAGRGELDGQRVVKSRQFVCELDVHDRADDLNDFAFVHDWNFKFAIGDFAMSAANPAPSGRW
jgi:hypothetical protein